MLYIFDNPKRAEVSAGTLDVTSSVKRLGLLGGLGSSQPSEFVRFLLRIVPAFAGFFWRGEKTTHGAVDGRNSWRRPGLSCVEITMMYFLGVSGAILRHALHPEIRSLMMVEG